MMNFQSMKNEQELNTMHDSFLTALRKYKVLARGEQFISENGAITEQQQRISARRKRPLTALCTHTMNN